MNIWKLILIVLGIVYLLAALAYRRWIRPDCGLSEAELDCGKCKRPCAAPFGAEEAAGFHLGAKLLAHEEVERQLTAELVDCKKTGKEPTEEIRNPQAASRKPPQNPFVPVKGRWL